MSTFLINRFADKSNYGMWQFDPDASQLFTEQMLNPSAGLDPSWKMIAIGSYTLAWGNLTTVEVDGQPQKVYPYELRDFSSSSSDPLNGTVVQGGHWPLSKFYGYWTSYSCNASEQDSITLIPMGTYVLFFVGAEGRGTYSLFSFDPNMLNPNMTDPLVPSWIQMGSVSFQAIQGGHELIPCNNYVVDRLPGGTSYRVWSFDPQDNCPLSIPEVCEGQWSDVQPADQLVNIGEYILKWRPSDLSYTLYRFDALATDPFGQVVSQGTLPEAMRGTSSMTAIQTIDAAVTGDGQPGTLDYMRSKIKHVVYYMLESRSFDNVCGWLYETDQSLINFIGGNEPYDGASTAYSNYDPCTDQQVYVSKFMGGGLSNDYDLNDQSKDPFHSNADTLLEFYADGYYGYKKRAVPDMSGFIRNNASPDVMLSLTPEQLPVLNGLAKNFAISDKWFSSVAGGTTMNRAFSLTGSALNKLYSWEGGNVYTEFSDYQHRQSIWKLLYSNGIHDFKIYNSMIWMGFPYTYHLFLQGQVPSIDSAQCDYTASMNQFKEDAKNGNLPAFSYLEPYWIAPSGTTSYHPKADLVPGEMALNDVYNALKNSPQWKDTLFVVTFSKGGGIYDHAVPPYATKGWPNDNVNGFEYDLMGQRVPAIFVSPWIKQNTVIRSGSDIPFDSTSFAATLLNWFGIPKAKWGLGDRMDQAPTFEAVFQETAARQDAPTLSLPYDKSHPKK